MSLGHCTESWHHWRTDYWSAHKTGDKRWETHFSCISQHINTHVPDLDLHLGSVSPQTIAVYSHSWNAITLQTICLCTCIWEPGSWVLCIYLCCFTWTAAVWSVTGASWTYCTWMSGGREEPSTAVAPPSADATAISWAPRSTCDTEGETWQGKSQSQKTTASWLQGVLVSDIYMSTKRPQRDS